MLQRLESHLANNAKGIAMVLIKTLHGQDIQSGIAKSITRCSVYFHFQFRMTRPQSYVHTVSARLAKKTDAEWL